MIEPKMEIMDWKNIEREAEAQYRQSMINREIAKILYEYAIINIKKAGGMTNREEEQQAKEQAKCDKRKTDI